MKLSSIKRKLLFTLLPAILFFFILLFIKNYFFHKQTIDELLNNKLKNLSNSMQITIKSMVTFSIKNYLKGISIILKSNLSKTYNSYISGRLTKQNIINNIYSDISDNTISLAIFETDVKSLKTQIINKPDFLNNKEQINDLIKNAKSEISGYGRITVSGANNQKTNKSYYFFYNKKYNWNIFLFIDKKEVKKLIQLEYVSKDVLSLSIGKNGFAAIMDKNGNFLIHPIIPNENAYNLKDANGEYVFREVINKKNGNFYFNWVYPDGNKKSIMYFRYIEDIELFIIFISPLDEHYGNLYYTRLISFIAFIIISVVISIIIISISLSIVKPLNNIISVFNEITGSMVFKEVDEKGDMEIKSLCKAFNIMIQQIKYYSENLEKIVEERTIKLSQTNDSLVNSEDRFHKLSNATFEGIILHDGQFIVDCNESLPNLLGYESNELIGQNIYDFISIEYHDITKEKIESHDEEPYELKFIKKDNTVIDVEICAKISSYKNKEIRIVAVRDITLRKKQEAELEKYREHLEEIIKDRTKELQISNENLAKAWELEQSAKEEMESAYEEAQSANEELEQSQNELEKTNVRLEHALQKAEEANRLKTEFLAIMSHELRTPLTGMLGFSELLVKDINLNDYHKKFVSYIFNSGKRLLDVLNDILEISVIEAGKITIEYNRFNIENIIYDIEILLKDKMDSKNLIFKKELNGITQIYSDPARIRQILLNLIGNAVKFTEQGEVKISIKIEGNNYLFSIRDTGIGISDDNVEKIFNIFTQVEDTMKRKYGGTGLGLNICKKLIEVLKGKIWAESTPGKGSTFYFTIPITENKNDITIDEKIETEKTPELKRKINVLFAEDDETNYFLIKAAFGENKNYSYKGFTNGKELLDEYKINQNYDIILLDIQMPVMDGETCLKEIRKINTKIPVIALTAFAMKSDKEKYLNIGFNGYISKPLSIKALFNKIEQQLSL